MNDCICRKCGPPWRDEHPESPLAPTFVQQLGLRSWMALCSTCGNKRCPAATDHDLPCTGSNAPGQLGSAYA